MGTILTCCVEKEENDDNSSEGSDNFGVDGDEENTEPKFITP